MKLSKRNISEILKNPYHKGEFLINVKVDKKNEEIILVFDDFEVAKVPFSHFKPSGDGTKANFSKVSIIDHGFTLKLGKYESSSLVLTDYKLK